MPMKTRSRIALTAIVLATTIGCASQMPARTLAEKTAANVGVISSYMERLASSSRAMTERRAANVAELHAANAELRARYRYDVELTKKAGQGGDVALVKDIEAWGKTVEELRVDRAKAAADHQQAILAARQEIDTQSDVLSDIAIALAGLAQEESTADRLRFMVGYTMQVKAQLDKRLEEDDDSAKRAKLLLDSLKSSEKEKKQ
jgi:hypothetical protein